MGSSYWDIPYGPLLMALLIAPSDWAIPNCTILRGWWAGGQVAGLVASVWDGGVTGLLV